MIRYVSEEKTHTQTAPDPLPPRGRRDDLRDVPADGKRKHGQRNDAQPIADVVSVGGLQRAGHGERRGGNEGHEHRFPSSDLHG